MDWPLQDRQGGQCPQGRLYLRCRHHGLRRDKRRARDPYELPQGAVGKPVTAEPLVRNGLAAVALSAAANTGVPHLNDQWHLCAAKSMVQYAAQRSSGSVPVVVDRPSCGIATHLKVSHTTTTACLFHPSAPASILVLAAPAPAPGPRIASLGYLHVGKCALNSSGRLPGGALPA